MRPAKSLEAIAIETPGTYARAGRGRHRHWGALALIILLAAIVRFPALSNAGPLSVDEGRYALDGVAKHNEIAILAGMLKGKLAESAGGREFRLDDALPEAARTLAAVDMVTKPGIAYTAGAVMCIAGLRTWAAGFVEIVAGLLTIVLLYLLVRQTDNNRSAWLAALAASLSNYHIFFSRNAYPQTTSALFFVLAIWCHWRCYKARAQRPGGGWWLFAAGTGAGVSLWFNFQVIPALGALAVIHLLASLRAGTWAGRVGRFLSGAVFMATGFFVVIALTEALTYPLILLFRSQGLTYPHRTFLELLLPRITGHGVRTFQASGIALLPFFLMMFEGAARTLTVTVACVWAGVLCVRRRAGDEAESGESLWRLSLYIGLPFVLGVAGYSFLTIQGARMFTYAWPFLAAGLGVALDRILRSFGAASRARRWAMAAVLVVAVAAGLPKTWEILSIRSGYPEVAEFLDTQDDKTCCNLWSSSLTMQLVDRAGTWEDPGDAPRVLHTGYRFYVSDWQDLYYKRYPDECPYVPEGAQPVAAFTHRFGRIYLETEAFPQTGSALENMRWVRGLDLERARAILVYDVAGGVTPPAD